jgi:hypothetical protein
MKQENASKLITSTKDNHTRIIEKAIVIEVKVLK